MAVERIESERFPYLPIRFTLEERSYTVEAVVDTGFEGDLAVPPSLVPEGLPPATIQEWRVAGEAVLETSIYAGVAQLGGFEPVPASIAAIGLEAVIGRGITDRYRVIFEHGERVIVEP